MLRKIAVLGATGSIGKSAIDIISRNKDKFEVVLLAAHSKRREMEKLQADYPNAVCVLTEVQGKDKLLDTIKDAKADIAINGISGAAGLEPSLAALEAGSDLALANKETIVMAAPLVFRLAKEKNVNIIPVDSEHSAVFHLIQAYGQAEEILLTASGGPFKNYSLKEMENVTPDQALSHPTWKMGPKITIDSASMANKGLEIIEACALFNMPADKIKVVIHPQSIVHSMVRLKNGIIYAQLSKPDMRHPIHDALFWPKTAPCDLETLNFDSLSLDFEKPDEEKFPMLGLAKEAAKKGCLYPCAYNAANEEAVKAFLDKKTGFNNIPRITAAVLEEDWTGPGADKDTILEADRLARAKAIFYMEKIV
jgi:1-deoxy-D-xylulose-5-phosphate reductoisomerase